jgi:hypothetical protein
MREQTNNARRVHPDVLDTRLASHDPDVQQLKHEEIAERHNQQEKERRARQIPGAFRQWQARYAAHRIATFPVRMVGDDKVPAITNYSRVGLRASGQLAEKERFRDADMLGFMCGAWNKLTLLDVDTTDENVLSDALTRHGTTPLIVRTASGKWHAWYRHNGERRWIRAWGDDCPMDLLGGGVAVAPPSKIGRGTYEIIQGSLDDLDRLPKMGGLEDRLYRRPSKAAKGNGAHGSAGGRQDGDTHRRTAASAGDSPLKGMREHDARNVALFHAIGPRARELFAAGGSQATLLERALAHNRQCAEPMTLDEVSTVVGSVWRMTVEARNYIGQRGGGVALRPHEVSELIAIDGGQDGLVLISFLRTHNGDDARFMIANGLTGPLGWGLQRLREARSLIEKLNYVREVRAASGRGAALYRWVDHRL